MQTDDAAPRWVGGVARHKQPETTDMRGAAYGPKGYKERSKRKLEEMEELHAQNEATMDEDDQAGAGPASMAAEAAEPTSKRRKAEGVPFIPVSGRTWKVQAQRSSGVMKAQVKSSWEKKMKDKNTRQNFLEQKKEAVDAFKAKKKAAADQRRAARERKAANKEKSAVVQTINSATAKRMMKDKKQRKLLKKADTTKVEKQ